MGSVTERRTIVLIDGPNTYSAMRSLQLEMDFKKLRDWLDQNYGPILRINFYSTVDEDQTGTQSIRPLLDYLSYNGYNVVTKMIRTYAGKMKGNIEVELAVDMMLAMSYVDNVVIFSGDVNLKRAVSAVMSHGCRVTVVSTKEVDPPVISDELRRECDEFIELDNLASQICRNDKPALVAR